MIVTSLLALGSLYAIGLSRLWQSAGAGRGISYQRAFCFLLGLLALAAAFAPQLDAWADSVFFVHMLQHELLMVVAAPLLAASQAGVAFAWVTPGRHRRLSVWPHRLAQRFFIPTPAVACVVHAIALWMWHIPTLYELARSHEIVHACQHLTFLLTAWWFWWALAHSRLGRLGFGPAVLYLFATTVQSGALGALLVVSPTLWYTANSQRAGALGLTALQDQQLGGLLMWVPAGIIFVAAALVYLAAWLGESERRVNLPLEVSWRSTEKPLAEG